MGNLRCVDFIEHFLAIGDDSLIRKRSDPGGGAQEMNAWQACNVGFQHVRVVKEDEWDEYQ